MDLGYPVDTPMFSLSELKDSVVSDCFNEFKRLVEAPKDDLDARKQDLLLFVATHRKRLIRLLELQRSGAIGQKFLVEQVCSG